MRHAFFWGGGVRTSIWGEQVSVWISHDTVEQRVGKFRQVLIVA